jgi:Cytochrome P460
MFHSRKWGQTLVILLFTWLPALAAEPPGYPNGFRAWNHVKTMQIKLGHPLYNGFGGIHHIYANNRAKDGFRRGKFANGSVLVFDLHEAREEPFTTSEGPRKFVAVMHKHADRYRDTGGWGFEAFKGDSHKDRLVGADRNAARNCFQCHASQKASDYVFSAAR